MLGDTFSDKVAVTIQVSRGRDVPVAVSDRFRVLEDGQLVADTTPLFSVRTLDVTARELVYDPLGQQLYALVNQDLVRIDPETGGVSEPISLGDVVQRIVISDDGHYIYAVTNDSGSVRRFNTQVGRVDLEWDVGDFSYYGVAIGDIEPVPGRPTAVAIAQFSPVAAPGRAG